MALQDIDDNWVNDEDSLKHHVVEFYNSLYSSQGHNNSSFTTISTFPAIREGDFEYIGSSVTSQEVRKSLFSMKNYKSPGPDGFHPLFFKSKWDIVGTSIVKFVADYFTNPGKIKEVNQTLITMIPKCNEPAKVTQLRPIALCNVIYKVVTKVVAQRIRTILPYVISNNQSSFIPSRSTTDNILVLQEAIHSLNHMHGKKGFMILKIDMEKAYDRIEWSFIRDTLVLLNIPNNIRELIQHCISTASMSINWNGEPTSSFNSSRGLRQGDPLSPYLFVLALERLSHFIQDRVNEGRWKPLSFGRGGGPKLYHICFADDLVLVAEANNDQVILIKDALDRFCLNSGQKINFNKSKVFFSRNIVDSDATMLSHGLGIEKTHDLGMYLGAPMLHQRISRNSYTFIIDKMRKKLSSWKSNNLSFAGRVTLAQFSLSCIAGYVMQTTNIPASICEEAEKICRDFIWGSTNQHRKCHLVSWEKICRPKEEGGLGFRNLRILNQAYIHKLAWQMVADPNKLWVQVMRAKYKCGFLSTPNITTRSNSSNVWKVIVKAWEQVKPHLRWVINDGHGTRFWKDCWIPNCGVLAEQYSDSIPMGEIEYSVSSYVIDGDWNWNMLASRASSGVYLQFDF
jgi:hypothetical protein